MCRIQRVDTRFRRVNEQAFDPKIIAIGPYHRGKNNLERMEEHKLLYRDSLLRREGHNEELYVSVITRLENQARRCYAEPPNLTVDQFVRMLVLDGCFIMELFIRFHRKEEIFLDDEKLLLLKQDLLLFDNQIPFFVLFKLFSLYDENGDFVRLATGFFQDIFPGVGYSADYNGNMLEDNIHLLGLIHDNWLPSFAQEEARNENNLELIPSATELGKAGVKFERAVEGKDLLNIEFEGGTLRIPRLVIKDETECFFMNLIAYELSHKSMGYCHIISYVKFLNCLIKSPEDLKLLKGFDIIQSCSFNIGELSQIFNRINISITDLRTQFHYIDVFRKVNFYYRWHRWVEGLCQEFRRNPFTFTISGLALAVALLQLIFD